MPWFVVYGSHLWCTQNGASMCHVSWQGLFATAHPAMPCRSGCWPLRSFSIASKNWFPSVQQRPFPGECLGWLGWGLHVAIFHVEIGWKHHGDNGHIIGIPQKNHINPWFRLANQDWSRRGSKMVSPQSSSRRGLSIRVGVKAWSYWAIYLSIYLSVYDSGKGNMTIPSHGV